jgi:hypothetical protein
MFCDPVQLVDESYDIRNVFNHMSTDNSFEFVVGEWIRKLTKVMKNVGMTSRIGIYSSGAWKFILTAADIQNPFTGSRLLGGRSDHVN